MSSASAWDGGRTRHVRAPTLRTLPPPPGLPTVLAVCCGRSSARTRLRGPGNYTPLLYRCHWPEFIRLCRRRLLLRRACPCLVAGKGSAVYGEVTRPAGAGQVQPGGAGVTDEKGSRVLVRLLIACAAPCRCTRLASVKAAKKKKKAAPAADGNAGQLQCRHGVKTGETIASLDSSVQEYYSSTTIKVMKFKKILEGSSFESEQNLSQTDARWWCRATSREPGSHPGACDRCTGWSSLLGSRQRHGMEEEKPTSNAPVPAHIGFLRAPSEARHPSREVGEGRGNDARAPARLEVARWVGVGPVPPSRLSRVGLASLHPPHLLGVGPVGSSGAARRTARWRRGTRRRGSDPEIKCKRLSVLFR